MAVDAARFDGEVLRCPVDTDVRVVLGEVLAGLQAGLAGDRGQAGLVVVTRHAVLVAGEPVDVAQAAVWGLVRRRSPSTRAGSCWSSRTMTSLRRPRRCTGSGSCEPQFAIRSVTEFSVPRLSHPSTPPLTARGRGGRCW